MPIDKGRERRYNTSIINPIKQVEKYDKEEIHEKCIRAARQSQLPLRTNVTAKRHPVPGHFWVLLNRMKHRNIQRQGDGGPDASEI